MPRSVTEIFFLKRCHSFSTLWSPNLAELSFRVSTHLHAQSKAAIPSPEEGTGSAPVPPNTTAGTSGGKQQQVEARQSGSPPSRLRGCPVWRNLTNSPFPKHCFCSGLSFPSSCQEPDLARPFNSRVFVINIWAGTAGPASSSSQESLPCPKAWLFIPIVSAGLIKVIISLCQPCFLIDPTGCSSNVTQRAGSTHPIMAREKIRVMTKQQGSGHETNGICLALTPCTQGIQREEFWGSPLQKTFKPCS